MEKRLGPLWDQIRHINTITVGTTELNVEWLICADYKFLCGFFGHQGASSRFPCLMCIATKPLPATSAELRKLETLRIGEHSITAPPLLPIQIESIVPPSFHIMHGVAQSVIDLVEKQAIDEDHEDEFGGWLKEVNCRRRKRGQNFTGMEIQRMLTHPNPDQMCNFVAKKELRDVLTQLMWVLRDLQSCSAQKQLEQTDMDRLDRLTSRLYQLWEWLDTIIPKNVTPKIHMLCAHLPVFARSRGWFAAVSEQAIEHLHASFNRLAIFHLRDFQSAYCLRNPDF